MYFYSATYYGDMYTESTENEVDYTFLSEGIEVENGQLVGGTGYCLNVVSYATSADENRFPNTGTYTMSETEQLNGLMPGTDFGSGIDGCFIRKIQDGAFTDDDPIFFVSGTMQLSGTMSSATFTMNFKGDDGKDYTFAANNQQVSIYDAIEGAFADYETVKGQTYNLTGTSCTVAPGNGAFNFELNFDDGYTLFGRCINGTDTIPYIGTFTVGDGSAGQPNTMFASSGVSNGSVYYSFAGKITADGYIGTDEPIFFIQGGSLTIAEGGINGTLTTHYNNTLNISYTGDIQVSTEAPAQRVNKTTIPTGKRGLPTMRIK